jgi:probable phosphoglycerate mutase
MVQKGGSAHSTEQETVMRLLIIRHGDPDYSIDSLTEKGWKEAQLLSERLAPLDVKEFFVSPLGRAKDTASLTLERMGRTATEYEWLREFPPLINRPDADHPKIAWDWLPQDWTAVDDFYRMDRWFLHPAMQEGHIKEEYDRVAAQLDELLARYGYVRSGRCYQAVRSNHDTLVFFCHFGLGCVLISHLLGISPMVLWHGLCGAPTSVAVLTTEERRKGIASFRMNSYGDISHLYAHGEEPAFAARFCECYEDEDQRHD